MPKKPTDVFLNNLKIEKASTSVYPMGQLKALVSFLENLPVLGYYGRQSAVS